MSTNDAAAIMERISSLEKTVDEKISGLDKKLSGEIGNLDKKLSGEIGDLKNQFNGFGNQLKTFDEKLSKVSNKLDFTYNEVGRQREVLFDISKDVAEIKIIVKSQNKRLTHLEASR